LSDTNITFILYQRGSSFEVMHAVYTDLYYGFKELGITPEMVEITDQGLGASQFSPDFPVRRINADTFTSLLDKDKLFLTDDSYSTVRLLGKTDRNNNLIVWVHYVYGHKFVFKQYRDLPFGLPYWERLQLRAIEFVPPVLTIRQAKWYTHALKKAKIISQSLWTGMLVNRVYNLKCSGIVYIPVDPSYYDVDIEQERESKCLIFFGSNYDMDIDQLRLITEIARGVIPGIEFEGFGNRLLASQFEHETGISIRFHNSVERRRLSQIYSSCIFTICPIYNGTFEKVPIESLLNGTPVISYIQPFMEVTGETDLVANIQNTAEVRSRLKEWVMGDLSRERKEIKERILSVMEHKKIARDFLRHFANFS
jgi:glycosyltransferase involved in cell wall biosynthesis